MIEIVKGSEQKIKAEMKLKAKTVPTPSQIKKRYGKPNLLSPSELKKLNLELKQNEVDRMMYSVTRTLPAQVGDLIINYKILQDYLKKLKGFMVELEVTPFALELRYSNKEAEGKLELFDIASHFETFEHVPVAQINTKQLIRLG